MRSLRGYKRDLQRAWWSAPIEPADGERDTTDNLYLSPLVPWKHITAMSTAVWPPIDDARLADEQATSQARELEWLLVQLRETLQSLKAGLEECAALLAPSENGSTLVLTSVRSESLKGLITRIGTRITKGVRC